MSKGPRLNLAVEAKTLGAGWSGLRHGIGKQPPGPIACALSQLLLQNDSRTPKSSAIFDALCAHIFCVKQSNATCDIIKVFARIYQQGMS